MTLQKHVKKYGRAMAEGLKARQVRKYRKELEDSTAGVKSRTGWRIMDLAERLRGLSLELDDPRRANRVARKLEETADYVRFRPTPRMAHDAIHSLNRKPVYLTAGTVAAAALALAGYRRWKKS